MQYKIMAVFRHFFRFGNSVLHLQYMVSLKKWLFSDVFTSGFPRRVCSLPFGPMACFPQRLRSFFAASRKGLFDLIPVGSIDPMWRLRLSRFDLLSPTLLCGLCLRFAPLIDQPDLQEPVIVRVAPQVRKIKHCLTCHINQFALTTVFNIK
jgi:hypothetical protein